MAEEMKVMYLVEREEDYGDGVDHCVCVGVFIDKADAEKYVKYMNLKKEFHYSAYNYGIANFVIDDGNWKIWDDV